MKRKSLDLSKVTSQNSYSTNSRETPALLQLWICLAHGKNKNQQPKTPEVKKECFSWTEYDARKFSICLRKTCKDTSNVKIYPLSLRKKQKATKSPIFPIQFTKEGRWKPSGGKSFNISVSHIEQILKLRVWNNSSQCQRS